MKTQMEKSQTVDALMHRWRQSHKELDEFFDEYRQWSYEVAQRGFPHFGEASERLKRLRECLHSHFSQEDAISDELVVLSGRPTPEIEANRRALYKNSDEAMRTMQTYLLGSTH